MNRYRTLIIPLLVLALVQLACAMPVVGSKSTTPTAESSPTFTFPTLEPTATSGPIVITATPDGSNPTATTAPTATQAAPTATTAPSSGNNNTGACTYRATFIADVTIPDDSVLPAGASFTKTWRVRNDGTCTWGPSAKLHALAFTGGSKLNGPDQVSLSGEVRSGQTVDISVNLVAPTTNGTYTSEWKFRVDGDPNFSNTYLGLGPGGTQPLFTRIKVGSVTNPPTKTPTPTTQPSSSTRLSFNDGGTSAVTSGSLKANESKTFVLSAGRGQTLMASATGGVTVSLAAKDGTALKVFTSPDGKNTNAWLPTSGDFLITVKAGGSDTTFNLTATVPARINFASGAFSASVDGKISGKLPNTYFLNAAKDQTMTISVTSSGNVVGLKIYGLQDGKVLTDSGSNSWSGTLPATQDYVIVVVPTADSATYTINVTVQ